MVATLVGLACMQWFSNTIWYDSRV